MSKSLVDLALKALSCSQKELALKLKVSPTQITKWKKGEHMSSEMRDKLSEIAELGEMDPDFVLLAGTLQEAVKWDNLIHYLAETANFYAETGYETEVLSDDLDLLNIQIFKILNEMGVSIPEKFPAALDIDYENDEEYELETILENPYADLIYDIFTALTNVYGFYIAYIVELIDNDDLNLYETDAVNIEPCLMWLAACKINVSDKLAPNFKDFKHSTLKDFRQWLTTVKYKAMSAGIPLRAELLDLVYRSSEELGQDAEAESLGFNKTRIHPDIYMNELLTGMRAIHQILPFIMKKMGIFEEFQPDSSQFYLD